MTTSAPTSPAAETKSPPPEPITLTGYVGSDREIRFTPERTEIRLRVNEIAEMEEEVEVTIPARAYAVLSMATQERQGSQWKTTWHRLVVWNVCRTREHYAARLARKGDQITVTGHRETVELEGGRTLTQVVVRDLRILRHKIREEQP